MFNIILIDNNNCNSYNLIDSRLIRFHLESYMALTFVYSLHFRKEL